MHASLHHGFSDTTQKARPWGSSAREEASRIKLLRPHAHASGIEPHPNDSVSDTSVSRADNGRKDSENSGTTARLPQNARRGRSRASRYDSGCAGPHPVSAVPGTVEGAKDLG